jgi:putative ABC transport system permease protein
MGLTPGREQRLLRHSLLVIEVGLAVVLLASAGLLARSFVNVMHYESGFDSSNTLTGVTLLSRERYPSSGERIRNFVDQLLLRLKALPGVEVAAVTTALPLESYIPNGAILYEGVPIPPIGKWPTAAFTKVTPEYFRAVGTPIFRGRTFTLADNETSIHVAIVNRTFARQFFAGDALGKRFKTNTWGQNQFTAVTIVGIADDVRHSGLEHEVQPEIFLPMAQLPEGRINIALRISGDPGLLANAMREAVTAVDPEQPLFDIQTMEERVSSAVAQRRLIMSLIACFAMLAVVLSAVGVYGVFAYSVSQRAHEMGIRLALGASRRGSLRLVVMQAARLIVLGGALGLAVAFALSRFLASLLVGITPHDAVSFSLAWLLMTVVALLASTIPATDAARTDIVSVLHSE